jgi:hypothetical protein
MNIAGKKIGDYVSVIVVPAAAAIATALLATFLKLVWFSAFWFFGLSGTALTLLDILVYIGWAVTVIVFLALAVWVGRSAAQRNFSRSQIAATGALMGAVAGGGVILYRTFTIVRKIYTQGFMESLIDVVKYVLIIAFVPLILAAVFAGIAVVVSMATGRKK